MDREYRFVYRPDLLIEIGFDTYTSFAHVANPRPESDLTVI